MKLNINEILQHPYVAMILNYVGFGLSAGVVAKLILPGSERMGWIRTILVGIIGSFIGSMISSYLGFSEFGVLWSLPSFISAVGGAILLLLLNRLVTQS